FERCCLAWLRDVASLLGVGHSAIDGQTLCGSANSTWGPLHLVSAGATQAHLCVGQVAVAGNGVPEGDDTPAEDAGWPWALPISEPAGAQRRWVDDSDSWRAERPLLDIYFADLLSGDVARPTWPARPLLSVQRNV